MSAVPCVDLIAGVFLVSLMTGDPSVVFEIEKYFPLVVILFSDGVRERMCRRCLSLICMV